MVCLLREYLWYKQLKLNQLKSKPKRKKIGKMECWDIGIVVA
jgi:hypothetical protein